MKEEPVLRRKLVNERFFFPCHNKLAYFWSSSCEEVRFGFFALIQGEGHRDP